MKNRANRPKMTRLMAQKMIKKSKMVINRFPKQLLLRLRKIGERRTSRLMINWFNSSEKIKIMTNRKLRMRKNKTTTAPMMRIKTKSKELLV